MNKHFIIGTTIIIFSFIFVLLPFLLPHPDLVRPPTLPSSILIETDENISLWHDMNCTEPLEISLEELNNNPLCKK